MKSSAFAAGIWVLLSAWTGPLLAMGERPDEPDPADKAASAVVEPVERAKHDAILDLPLKDEIQAVEQSLLQLGVLAEFPDVFGATEIDYVAARFLVFYNENAASNRVAAFLQRVDAVDAPAELTVVAVPAGYAAAERQLVLRELLRQGAELAAELGVSRITGGGIDHRTGQILIHTSDEIVGRTVTIDEEPIRLVGSTSPAITGFTSDASTFPG